MSYNTVFTLRAYAFGSEEVLVSKEVESVNNSARLTPSDPVAYCL